jgi:hypothetical protein
MVGVVGFEPTTFTCRSGGAFLMYFIEQYALHGEKLLITLRDKVIPLAMDLEIPLGSYTDAELKAAIGTALERRERDRQLLGQLKAMKDARVSFGA